MNPHISLEDPLWAVSSIDGRYQKKTRVLSSYFSEAAFLAYRLRVEILWFLHLAKHLDGRLPFSTQLDTSKIQALHALVDKVPETLIVRVKKLEEKTQHDVKAIEYALREEFSRLGIGAQQQSLLHFAATSEDINNLAYGLMIQDCLKQVFVPKLKEVHQQLCTWAHAHKDVAMLGRTHGQSASPTTVGKEFAVFAFRFKNLIDPLSAHQAFGKCNGAVGNFNAHYFAIPTLDWPKLSRDFVENTLHLAYNPLTTQIESHDRWIELCALLSHVSGIGIGLCRDLWAYISLGYFEQNIQAGSVGSSTMPHKINPIDFENAEGNFGLGLALAQHMQSKLAISRWQRDLSDSTVLRNVGVMFAYEYIALDSLLQGLKKLRVSTGPLQADLDGAWEVLSEAVQTVMRSQGVLDAYERLKDFSRGQKIDRLSLHTFIDQQSELSEEAKSRLKALTPATYLGLASQLAGNLDNSCNA